MDDRRRLPFLATLAALSVAVRILPFALQQLAGLSIEPGVTRWIFNFSPFPAVCLFGAAFLHDARWRFGLPVVTWLLGDALIALISPDLATTWRAYIGHPFLYAWIALSVCLGTRLRTHRTWGRILATGVASSTAFFLLTNFPFWLFQVNPVDYPPNLQGLVDCYAAAIPFWRNHMVGTLLYSALLFSPLGVAQLERGVRAARGATSALAAK